MLGARQVASLGLAILAISMQPSASYASFLDQMSSALATQPRRRLLEGSCGDFTVCSGQAMPTAILSNDPSQCLYDGDFNMWTCGDYVMTQEMYDSIQSPTCVSDCTFEERVVSAKTVEDGFYWQSSEWGPCSSSCGGGTQQRSVQCRQTENNALVANDNCQALKPPVIQACNKVPCELQSLSFKETLSGLTECSAACGSGWQEQPMLCALDDGFLAPRSFCSNSANTPSLLLCNTQPCQGTRWEVGPWSECSQPCDGGIMTRSVTCLGQDNTPVGLDQCAGEMPAAKVCNINACKPSAWLFGPFDECQPENGECGPGVQTRGFPACQDSDGSFSVDCAFPGPTNTMPCFSTTPCESCPHDCFGRGQCVNGQCSCAPGWRGQFCEMSIDACPQGVLDQSGACCNTGVVDLDGTCCPDLLATLDARGFCCPSGKVDAAGTCDGSATVIDIKGKACEGLLDAAGTCCSSGLVDECGVCEGNGQSCAMQATVLMIRDHESSPAPPAGFVFTSFMAAILGMKASQVTLDSVEQYVKSTLGVPEEGYRVQVTVSPSPDGTLMVTTAAAAYRLNSQQGSKSPTGSVFLAESVQLLRMPICGNGICEIGERILQGSSDDGLGCSDDCGHGYSPCPVTEGLDGALECSGRGRCFTVPGECLCFEGHYGAACEKCQPGWVKYGSTCVFQTDKAGLAQGTLVASLSSILLSVAAGAVVSVAVIAGYTLIVRHRRKSRVSPDDCHDTNSERTRRGSSTSLTEPRTPMGSACGNGNSTMHGVSARVLDNIMHQSAPSFTAESPRMMSSVTGLASPLSGTSSRRINEALAPLAIDTREPSGRGMRSAASAESPLAANIFSLRRDVLKQQKLKELEPKPTMSALRTMMEPSSSLTSPFAQSPESQQLTSSNQRSPFSRSISPTSSEPLTPGKSAARAGKSPLSKAAPRRTRSSNLLSASPAGGSSSPQEPPQANADQPELSSERLAVSESVRPNRFRSASST